MWLNLQLAQLLLLRDPEDSAFTLTHCHSHWEWKMISCSHLLMRKLRRWPLNYPRPHSKSTGEPRLDLPSPAHAPSHILRPNFSFTHPKMGNLNSALSRTSLPGHHFMYYSFRVFEQNYLFLDHQQHARCWFRTWRVLWAEFCPPQPPHSYVEVLVIMMWLFGHRDFLKRFYLFIFRERGREWEREREKHQCVVASHVAPTGDLAYNANMCPDWELNWRPFGLHPMLNPLSCTSQGKQGFLKIKLKWNH